MKKTYLALLIVILALLGSAVVALTAHNPQPEPPPLPPFDPYEELEAPPPDTGAAGPEVAPPPADSTTPDETSDAAPEAPPEPPADKDVRRRELLEREIAEDWPEVPPEEAAELTDSLMVDISTDTITSYRRYLIRDHDPDGFAAEMVQIFAKYRVREDDFRRKIEELQSDQARLSRFRRALFHRLARKFDLGDEGEQQAEQQFGELLRRMGLDRKDVIRMPPRKKAGAPREP